ncbi:MAG: hypothetical protein ACAH83_15370 [Alphaproteobacteria bacterium]
MFSDFYFSSRWDRDRYRSKPELHKFTEIEPESQDDAIKAWAKKHDIADAATISAAKKLVAGRHQEVRYFIADSNDMSGSIKTALIIYDRGRYDDTATYHMALIFRDGRMALATATYKRKDGSYSKERISQETAAARCQRLLEEALGVHSEQKFELRSDSSLLKFPEKPDSYSRRESWRGGWYLPSDLKEVAYVDGTPFWEKGTAYKQNFEQDFDSEIYGACDDDPHLKKIMVLPGQQYHSKMYDDLKKLVAAHEKDRFSEAWSFFKDRLDPDILKACKHVGITSAAAYNWLAGNGDSYKSGPRIQAAQANGLFFRVLPFREVTAAIDNGQPLDPVLAKIAVTSSESEGLPKALKVETVQRLREQFKPEDLALLPHDHVWHDNWSRLEALPPEWWPKTKEDIVIYRALVDVSEKYKEICGMSRMDILREVKGQWQEAGRLLQDDPRHSIGSDKTPQYYQTPGDLEHYLKALHRELYMPVLLKEAETRQVKVEDSWWEKSPVLNDRTPLIREIFNGVSFMDRVALLRKWHRNAELNDAMEELGLAAGLGRNSWSWAPVTAPQTAPNGVSLVPLVNETELRQQGDSMRNRASSYTDECRKGEMQFIALKSAAGENLSILQLRILGDRVSLAQNRTANDTEPSPEAKAAAEWYITAINDKKIETALDRISHMKSMTDTAKSAARHVGFDLMDHDARSKAFDIYKPCLPERFQQMDYDTWLKETKLDENAKTLVILSKIRQAKAAMKAGPK